MQKAAPLFLTRLATTAIVQQIRETDDRIQRCPQFMTDIGQEMGFRPRGDLGLVTGAGHRFLGQFARRYIGDRAGDAIGVAGGIPQGQSPVGNPAQFTVVMTDPIFLVEDAAFTVYMCLPALMILILIVRVDRSDPIVALETGRIALANTRAEI